jgi:hypothetical protein
LDFLSIYLIRNVNGSTIISYHPAFNLPTTTALFFHTRIRFAGTQENPKPIAGFFTLNQFGAVGQSVHWQKIFQGCPDPIFVFLTFIWHALYAWDEALQTLYNHICDMVSLILHAKKD